jgi:hypothetical protein
MDLHIGRTVNYAKHVIAHAKYVPAAAALARVALMEVKEMYAETINIIIEFSAESKPTLEQFAHSRREAGKSFECPMTTAFAQMALHGLVGPDMAHMAQEVAILACVVVDLRATEYCEQYDKAVQHVLFDLPEYTAALLEMVIQTDKVGWRTDGNVPLGEWPNCPPIRARSACAQSPLNTARLWEVATREVVQCRLTSANTIFGVLVSHPSTFLCSCYREMCRRMVHAKEAWTDVSSGDETETDFSEGDPSEGDEEDEEERDEPEGDEAEGESAEGDEVPVGSIPRFHRDPFVHTTLGMWPVRPPLSERDRIDGSLWSVSHWGLDWEFRRRSKPLKWHGVIWTDGSMWPAAKPTNKRPRGRDPSESPLFALR